MTRDEHVKYWMEASERDWDVAMTLFDQSKYVYSLFFIHLSLEKLAKGHWIKENENNYPPRIHNIIRLITASGMEIPNDYLVFLDRLNDFQIEGRYPDYSFDIFKTCNKQFAEEIISQATKIKKWLIEKLQS
jgi:HEPN domain-containing protein